MQVSIIPADRTIVVDGVGVCLDFEIDSAIHAVQWSGASGHIEYTDDRANQAIDDISDFQHIIDAHALAIQQAEEERIAYLNSWDHIRVQRNARLTASDWTQLGDSVLSEETRALWSAYRQALRDLPQTYETPADVVWPAQPE